MSLFREGLGPHAPSNEPGHELPADVQSGKGSLYAHTGSIASGPERRHYRIKPRPQNRVPGIAVFPAEMSEWPPRTYVERIFNVAQWTEMKCGGHFAAMEQPELLVNDIVEFAKKLVN